ncbi:hypothetical protein [Candidatus Francisella endociliophora]|uniref:hypothetical protein n=1 Tax=Candidatus Francisella endociliophora TaxID=653937 RepID=UPI000694B92D|nr:hypothetical protein [Francisella sp. FSC1006]
MARAKSFGSFAKKIADIDVKENVAKNLRVYSLKLYSRIQQYSPVDSGQFRFNNRLTIYNRTNQVSSNSSKSKNTSQAKSETDRYKDISKPIYIQNNLPYAEVIEDGLYPKNPKKGSWNKKTKSHEIRSQNGYSKQATSGVYKVALEDVQFKPKSLLS